MRALLIVVAGVVLAAPTASSQVVSQLRHWSGQGVAPVYEGFDINPDGSFNMWFGYMNRNYEEELDLPVGPDNRIEPAPPGKSGPDAGQPTHFDTRRHKDVFSVTVPKDFGSRSLTWSLTMRGKTESIAATLNPVWQIDRRRTTRGGNSENVNSNTPPVVTAEPPQQSMSVSKSATLNIAATDDGLPRRRGGSGMTVEWEQYRGPGHVTFAPAKQAIANGKATATATFSAPGSYTLMAVVDDGSGESAGNFGYHCCWTNALVTVTVTP